MAKLCMGCKDKKPDTSIRGTCITPNYVPQAQLPQKHEPWTESMNFNHCEACAEHFNRCQWCGGPLNGSGYSMVPTNKQFTRQFDKDNGGHVEGMYVGEQILAQFVVDLYSGKTWRVRSTSRGVRLANQRLITEGEETPWGFRPGRYGWLELYFDLNEADPKAHIELEEATSSWWVSLANPKTWKITVEVKH